MIVAVIGKEATSAGVAELVYAGGLAPPVMTIPVMVRGCLSGVAELVDLL